jgi:hypothetical protein
LHTRRLEYHNNIHANNPIQYPFISLCTCEDWSANFYSIIPLSLSSVIVAQVLLFNDDESCVWQFNFLDSKENHLKIKHHSLTTPQSLTESLLPTFLSHFEHKPLREAKSKGFVWIDLMELSALSLIAEKFGIHEICCRSFFDLRAHSAILPVPSLSQLMVCVCSCQSLPGSSDCNLGLFKLAPSPLLEVLFSKVSVPQDLYLRSARGGGHLPALPLRSDRLLRGRER